MKKQNVTMQSKGILNNADAQILIDWINKSRLNLQDYDGKKVVSFWDDDGECYFVLRIPYTSKTLDYFDIDMLDLTDRFGDMYGVSNCKYDGEFLQ